MAIVVCNTCGTKHSDRAPECPSCRRAGDSAVYQTIADMDLATIKKTGLACLFLILVFGIVGLYFLSFLKKENQQYEYTIIAPKDGELFPELEKAGKFGWEIVSTRRAVNDGEGVYEIMLKRTKSLPRE